MTWVATAVIGSAVIGAVGSSVAGKKAAKAAERGQDILAASRDEARADVNRLFPQAQERQGQAQRDFREFLAGQVLPQQTQPFQQGNMAAQQQVQRGLSATQAAILGLAPDLSGFQARSFAPPQFNLPQPEAPAVFDNSGPSFQSAISNAQGGPNSFPFGFSDPNGIPADAGGANGSPELRIFGSGGVGSRNSNLIFARSQ